MNDCSQHKKNVAGISDMKVLAEMIGDLHYQKLPDLFFYLNLKFGGDSMKDEIGGRIGLSKALHELAVSMSHAYDHANKAWQISKSFMK